MTINKTLKRSSRLARARNVLKREERIDQLKKTDKWVEGTSTATGLPKVRIIKTVVGKKKKKEKKEEAADDKKGKKKK